MIIKKIYLIQQKKYYGYDLADDEDIEETMLIGYFTSLKTVELAKKICLDNGIDEKTFEIKSFNLLVNNNQKFIFVLSHSYSIKESDGTFTDFEYIFEPQSSKEKCLELKEKLKNNSKFEYQKIRDYSIYPPDGFIIDKYKLNCMYFPIYMMLEEI